MKIKFSKILVYLFIVFALLFIVGPFVYISMLAFKLPIHLLMAQFPFPPTWYNFHYVLFAKSADFFSAAYNSIIVASLSTIVVLIVGTLTAYSLAWRKWSIYVSSIMLGWTLIFQMIPPITLVGPWFLLFQKLGLYNTITGLVLTHSVVNLPLAIWLMMSAFQNIPRELEEAAIIDGSKRWKALQKILLPLVVPGLISAGLLAFLFSWSEFAIALNLTAKGGYTIPINLANYATRYDVENGAMASVSVMASIPAIFLMFIGQRFIIRGLTSGALK